ncbi:MAG: SPFH domain-containing protein [Fimbriimonadaceae bacterium]|nr:SPFH domain-containing protein [Fimbriimonadaceae bacterium]
MKEKHISALPGGVMLVVSLALFFGSLATIIVAASQNKEDLVLPGVIGIVVWSLLLGGFMVIEPNGSKVLLLFGKYAGTVREQGFYWTNPFQSKRNMSLRVRTLNGEKLKVNDLVGNPIEIAAIIVWQVSDTFKASFVVDSYEDYVRLQSETALRHSASSYPYDADDDQPSLRRNASEVSDHLLAELREKLAVAGVEVLEARLSHLAYAPEIAGAMLRRQQAAAVIAARQRIVDGAVGMVEMALNRMDAEGVIQLDEERKATMVQNLMVVLCSEHSAQPVVNAGTLYN